jgi:transcriptional regulator with XRE-family HTH domain
VPPDPPTPRELHGRRAIGDRIRETRLRRDLSQEQLAEAARLDRKTIYRVELGQTAARVDWLIRIADALQVPLADLVRDV